MSASDLLHRLGAPDLARSVRRSEHAEHRAYAATNEAHGIGVEDHEPPTLNAADVRRHFVNEMRDRVLRAGERYNRTGMEVGKANHASTAADKVVEASIADVEAGKAFSRLVCQTFADLLEVLDELGAPVVHRGEPHGS